MGDLLRDVLENDIAVFFDQQNDAEAIRMAVWVPRERDAFYEHWHRILADDELVAKTIVSGDEVAGKASQPGRWRSSSTSWNGRSTRRSRRRTSARSACSRSAGSRSSAAQPSRTRRSGRSSSS
jgi:activator of HSP90 ATPase